MDKIRFIPTPVGNASGMLAAMVGVAVHPHARGERPSTGKFVLFDDGSSPRPWGTLAMSAKIVTVVRFIPTPVGNA